MEAAQQTQHQRLEDVKLFLQSATSIDSYQERVTYRQGVQDALRQVVAVVSSSSDSSQTIHLDEDGLRACLLQIGWIDLCKQRDNHSSTNTLPWNPDNQQHVADDSTALRHVLECLRDPQVLPPAATPVLITQLTRTLLYYRPGVNGEERLAIDRPLNRHHWSSSQSLLLQQLDTLVDSLPAVQPNLARVLWDSFTSVAAASTRTSDLANLIGPLRRMLSLAKYWARRPAPSFFTLAADTQARYEASGQQSFRIVLFQVLCLLDNWQLQVLNEHEHRRHNFYRVQDINEATSVRSQSRKLTVSIDRLHGNESEEEADEQCPSRPKTGVDQSESLPSKQQVLEADASQSRVACDYKALMALQREMDRLCSQYLKVSLSLSYVKRRLEGYGLDSDVTFALDWLMSVEEQQSFTSYAPSILVYLLLVSVDEPVTSFYDTLSNRLDQLTTEIGLRLSCLQASGRPLSRTLLICYTELLSEMACFDDPDTFLPRAQSLVDLVLKFSLSGGSSDKDTVALQDVQSFLTCLTYLLSRRGNMMLASQSIVGGLERLSLRFGEPKYWCPPSLSPKDQEMVLLTLRCASILTQKDVEQCSHGKKRHSTNLPSLWSEFGRLRSLISRMPLLNLLQMLTSEDRTNDANLLNMPAPKFKSTEAVPVLKHLNADILHHVFSFVGYRRLANLRYVCKDFRDIADSNRLWHGIYKYRFGFAKDDPTQEDDTRPWKTYFVERWIASRHIRLRRHRSGWKVRLCKHVGCLQVLTSPERATRHDAIHRRKRKATENRKSTAKRAKASAKQAA